MQTLVEWTFLFLSSSFGIELDHHRGRAEFAEGWNEPDAGVAGSEDQPIDYAGWQINTLVRVTRQWFRKTSCISILVACSS